MAFVLAKCTNCGANLEVDGNSKTAICPHCGAQFVVEDVIVNNITNINYTEIIDGNKIDRNAVLDKLLTKYYLGEFDDLDNIKKYAINVQELDTHNVLANFVAFDKINSISSIIKLLKNPDLHISIDLFMILINKCEDKSFLKADLFKRMINNNPNIDNMSIFNKMLEINDKWIYSIMFECIYSFDSTTEENTKMLDIIFNDKNALKFSFLRQLKAFQKKHPDFKFDSNKYDTYIEHLKDLKKKQKELQSKYHSERSESNTTSNEVKQTAKRGKTKMILLSTSLTAIVLLIVLFILIFVVF